MNDPEKQALISYLLAMADDELILGHRASEWCGHAPILEEDIAFANLALDEIGHARQWYALASELLGQDPERYPDELVYHRPASEYHNAPIVELPNGDWAFSMLRQFLFDASERIRLERLTHSAYSPLAETAAKLRKEEIYHLRHTKAWVERLGLGTEESQSRLQNALDQLWDPAQDLFNGIPEEQVLVQAGIAPDSQELKADWEAYVLPFLESCELKIPTPAQAISQPRRQHTPYLRTMLAELQSLPMMDPEAEW